MKTIIVMAALGIFAATNVVAAPVSGRLVVKSAVTKATCYTTCQTLNGQQFCSTNCY